jgi:hypothetical protein
MVQSRLEGVNLNHRLNLILFLILIPALVAGCARTNQGLSKLTKPIDDVSQELGRVREVKSDSGTTRAVLAPQEEKKLRIPF